MYYLNKDTIAISIVIKLRFSCVIFGTRNIFFLLRLFYRGRIFMSHKESAT